MTAFKRNQNTLALGAILLAGFAIRLLLFIQPYTINPDGVLYIQQAQALALHDFKAVTACGLTFVSTYPLLVAMAHGLVHDWLFSARLISLIFGTLTLVPIFLTANLFFNRRISSVVCLVYAMIPAMVTGSVAVIRDPTCWFFMTTGIYLVLAATREERPAWLMVTGSFAFILAMLTRIETGILLAATLLYLCLSPTTKRWQMLTFFLLPPLIFSMVVGLTMLIANFDTTNYLRIKSLTYRLSNPFDVILYPYRMVRNALQIQIAATDNFTMQSFLIEARRGMWFLAIGAILNRFLEAFFYPYALLAIIGLRRIGREISSTPQIQYFLIMYIAVLAVLYQNTFTSWVIEYRYLMMLIIPCLQLVGYGLEELTRLATRIFHTEERIVIFIIGFLVFFAALPKNSTFPQHDDDLYKAAGEIIARAETTGSKLNLSYTSVAAQPQVAFYANQVNDSTFYKTNWRKIGYDINQNSTFTSADTLAVHLRKNSIPYFLWEDTYLPQSIKELRGQIFASGQFKKLGRWQKKNGGELLLFEVIQPMHQTPPVNSQLQRI